MAMTERICSYCGYYRTAGGASASHIDLRVYKYCPPDDPLHTCGQRWRCRNCPQMGMYENGALVHAREYGHYIDFHPDWDGIDDEDW